jgi:hypothetical protein
MLASQPCDLSVSPAAYHPGSSIGTAANAFRLLLHSFAYNLVNLFRLQLPSSMRSAQIETLRIQLFKIGAHIHETTRCIRIDLDSGWPFRDLFQTASLCNSA